MGYDAGDEKHVKKAEAKQEDVKDAESESLKYIMQDSRGRRFISDLLDQTHVFHSSYGATDRDTSFREGERNIGLKLLAGLHTHSLAEYMMMLQENEHATRGRRAKQRDRDTNK